LVSELVAGNPDDSHGAVEGLLECIEVWVLNDQPSVGRYVDQQDGLALEVREINISGAV